MDRIGKIIVGGLLCVLLTLLFILPFYDAERKVWKEIIKHSDEFVYSHVSDDGERACFKLFDDDGKYLCEAVLYLESRNSDIDRSFRTIAWRGRNKRFSHKMFKLLYPKIPEDDLNKFVSNDELVKRLKNMK